MPPKNKIKELIKKLLFNNSAFISTFIIYLTLTFLAVLSYIEIRKNIISEIALIFLLILEIQIILNFIISYLGLYHSLIRNKWVNFVSNILFFSLNFFLVYQSLIAIISQNTTITLYGIYLTASVVTLFVQSYLNDRANKKLLIYFCIISFIFSAFIYLTSYIFGNTLFSINQFFITQKQLNDSTFFLSLCVLITAIHSLFSVLKTYIPIIKKID